MIMEILKYTISKMKRQEDETWAVEEQILEKEKNPVAEA